MQNFSLGRFVLVHALISGMLSASFPAFAHGSSMPIASLHAVALMAPAPITEEEDLAETLAVFNNWLENGLPAKREVIADINGDSVADELIRSPGTLASASGYATIQSGETGETLLTLRPRPNERLFGLRAFVTDDMNGDGVPEIVVVTGLPGTEKGSLVVLSGANGVRLGAANESDSTPGFTIEITGDFNGDAIVNSSDIALMTAAIAGTVPLNTGDLARYDLDGDGVITSIDLAFAVERAQQEPGTGGPISAGIAAAWLSWGCWTGMISVAIQILGLLASAVACGALTGGTGGAAAIACYLALACQIVAIILTIGVTLADCLDAGDPILTIVQDIAELAAGLCGSGAFVLGTWGRILQGLRRLIAGINYDSIPVDALPSAGSGIA